MLIFANRAPFRHGSEAKRSWGVGEWGGGSGLSLEPQSKPRQMKVSKGQSQPELVAAAFLILHMALDSPFLHRSVLIVTHLRSATGKGLLKKDVVPESPQATELLTPTPSSTLG